MKRILILFLFLGALLVPCFASYQMFGDSLVFSWLPDDALYPESIVNPFSSTSTLNILQVAEGQPRSMKYTDTGSGEYDDVSIYPDGKYANEKLYLQLKTGLNIGLFRLSYKNVFETELGFQGALNSVFQGFGGADNLGFDGVFFFGINMRLFQKVAFRVGYQHYSGHYGDETLLKIDSSQTGDPVEYTRDNDLLFGVSVQPVTSVRLYMDASLPLTKSWMHPAIHIPSWVIKPSSGASLSEVESWNEQVAQADFADSYKAWIINTGVEMHYPLHNLGSLFLAAEVTANQDGQTLHEVGGYDPDNPWEFEYTVGTGIEFDQNVGFSHARIICTYHDGRFPLLNFFYQRTKYLGIGFSVSP
ncbi:hypothetical protein [uncultured Sphaerochaeta sp.]|uniref:hypothetical protein n=1 Tax=uncultured Sphaerochaeta sp. TaxID=886478 RepID=UPI002A0A3ED0|nr:hypothetical protein [uncultured Sphaerochaeta sp.]